MEDRMKALFALESMAKRDLSPLEASLLQQFAYDDPDEAAFYIDHFCPPLSEQEEAHDYIWEVWEAVGKVAGSPDATGEMQDHLVLIIQGLAHIAKGEVLASGVMRRAWADLPLFPEFMEACISNPLEDGFTEELSPKRAQGWEKLSSFAARCTGARVLGAYTELVDALRLALEGKLGIEADEDIARAECKVRVACEWISHCATLLLHWALENIGLSEIAEDDRVYMGGGPLYQGPQAVCLKRWSFWQTRFEELGNGKVPGLSDDVRQAAREAAKTMDAVERRVANTLE